MMKMTYKTLLRCVAGMAVSCSFSAQAFAQFSTDSSADTAVGADNAVTVGGVTTLTGQVDIRQGDARLLADKVVIYNRAGGGLGLTGSAIERFVATGNFYYITPDQEVRGNQGVYTASTDSFVVTGDVILLQDENVVTGDRLDYVLSTREAKVTADCSGRKCPRRQRVSILIKSSDAQVTN